MRNTHRNADDRQRMSEFPLAGTKSCLSMFGMKTGKKVNKYIQGKKEKVKSEMSMMPGVWPGSSEGPGGRRQPRLGCDGGAAGIRSG